jgi:pimeloyl-ACP methyl ester carboxylesterase
VNVIRWSSVWLVDHVIAAGWQFRRFSEPEVPSTFRAGEGAPVLLLPGVYEPWQFLRTIGERLAELGHPVHVLPELGYNRRPIAETAEQAAAYLLFHDLHHVIIIGHSKGGIVGKQLMVSALIADRIDSMVAINSPFSGSRFARYAPGATLRAFSPTDATLQTLSANLEANSRITSIYSSLDPVIPEGSHLEGAQNFELPLSGHFMPLWRDSLLELVVRVVESGRRG